MLGKLTDKQQRTSSYEVMARNWELGDHATQRTPRPPAEAVNCARTSPEGVYTWTA